MLIYDPKVFEGLVRRTLLNVYDVLFTGYFQDLKTDFDDPIRIRWNGEWGDDPYIELPNERVSFRGTPLLEDFHAVHGFMSHWVGTPECHRCIVFNRYAENIVRKISERLSSALGLGSVRPSVLLMKDSHRWLPLPDSGIRGSTFDALRAAARYLLTYHDTKKLSRWAPAPWSASREQVDDVSCVRLSATFRDFSHGYSSRACQELISKGFTYKGGEPTNWSRKKNPLIKEYEVRLWVPSSKVLDGAIIAETVRFFNEARDRIAEHERDLIKASMLCRIRIEFTDHRVPLHISMHQRFVPFVDRQNMLWYKDLFSPEYPRGVSLVGVKSIEFLQDTRDPNFPVWPWEQRDA